MNFITLSALVVFVVAASARLALKQVGFESDYQFETWSDAVLDSLKYLPSFLLTVLATASALPLLLALFIPQDGMGPVFLLIVVSLSFPLSFAASFVVDRLISNM